MLERDWEATVCSRIYKELGVESVKMNIIGNRGYPDRVFFMPLRPAWVEFKNMGKRPGRLQLYRILCMNNLGYDAKWSDTYEATYNWLKEIHAARLSEIRNQEDGKSGVRGAILGSGTWEDLYKSSRRKSLKR